jgi:hypothetical protein
MKKKLAALRRALFKLLFPDVMHFISSIYAMPRDPSYFIKLPDPPHSIKELFEP